MKQANAGEILVGVLEVLANRLFGRETARAPPLGRQRPFSLESPVGPVLDHEEPHPLSRFRILALFAVLTALASVFAACGGGGSTSSSEDPQKVLENASLEGVKSGELDLSLHVTSEGKEGGDVEVGLSGPFEAGAKGELPQLEMSAEAERLGEGRKHRLRRRADRPHRSRLHRLQGHRLRSRPDHLRVRQVGASNRPSSRKAPKAATSPPARRRPKGSSSASSPNNLTNEGSADVDGTSTTKVSGDLNVSGAIDALIQLTEDPACSSQLEAAGPLPLGELEEAKGELSKAIKKAHIDIYVGDDDIVRKIAVELTIEPPEAERRKGRTGTGTLARRRQRGTELLDALRTRSRWKRCSRSRHQPARTAGSGGSGGIGGLLEGSAAVGGGGSSSAVAREAAAPPARRNTRECLQGAETAADLQKCANLLK